MSTSVENLHSWGGRSSHGSRVSCAVWRDDELPHEGSRYLPFGMGRSYGDSCLLDSGVLLKTGRLDRIISFDKETGLLCCEAGCSLAQVLDFCIPRGWFLPVTPGTKFVTLGGCVANDVHGKNHHKTGTFGCFVNRLGLLRSDVGMLVCSSIQNSAYFSATIGGLGLTGLITWVEFRLRPIHSNRIRQYTVLLRGIDSFFEVARRLENLYDYTVAWLDSTYPGIPRGVLIAGNHLYDDSPMDPPRISPRYSIPFRFPDFALGRGAIRLMNTVYYRSSALSNGEKDVGFDKFFYPLDVLGNWNKAYGRKGLVQYQYVVPIECAADVLKETLRKVHIAKHASFLTVVKLFGSIISPGYLSFPRHGVTVCFDFPYLGSSTEKLMNDLDATVFANGGALYPAKDARMNRESFEKSYPNNAKFRKYMDPACSSNFAKRVGLVE